MRRWIGEDRLVDVLGSDSNIVPVVHLLYSGMKGMWISMLVKIKKKNIETLLL